MYGSTMDVEPNLTTPPTPPPPTTHTPTHSLLYLAHTKYGAFAHDRLSALAFLLFYAHVAWVHAPASVACHLIGNAGLSEHVHALSLELDYVCIFLASVRGKLVVGCYYA